MQPPSGGCVLKLRCFALKDLIKRQPPSGGCVLKLTMKEKYIKNHLQPPSGGCVLKLPVFAVANETGEAATFGWLCVETKKSERC